jgi:hypothetical protein
MTEFYPSFASKMVGQFAPPLVGQFNRRVHFRPKFNWALILILYRNNQVFYFMMIQAAWKKEKN